MALRILCSDISKLREPNAGAEFVRSFGVEGVTLSCVRPHRRLVRGLGAALALVTFASPLITTFHEATVRHVACPEDGELIEAPAQAAHQHAQVKGDGAALFSERDPAGPGASSGEHDHCAIAVQSHLRAREQSRQRAAIPGARVFAAATEAQEPAGLHSLAVYRIAPKASPPV